jgi:hypothetical protein
MLIHLKLSAFITNNQKLSYREAEYMDRSGAPQMPRTTLQNLPADHCWCGNQDVDFLWKFRIFLSTIKTCPTGNLSTWIEGTPSNYPKPPLQPLPLTIFSHDSSSLMSQQQPREQPFPTAGGRCTRNPNLQIDRAPLNSSESSLKTSPPGVLGLVSSLSIQPP